MKMSYYPESDSHNRSKIKVELDFSNFATKSEVKKATGVLASKFAIKAGLASVKSDVDGLDIDQLETLSTGLSRLTNVVDNDVVQRLYMIN